MCHSANLLPSSTPPASGTPLLCASPIVLPAGNGILVNPVFPFCGAPPLWSEHERRRPETCGEYPKTDFFFFLVNTRVQKLLVEGGGKKYSL